MRSLLRLRGCAVARSKRKSYSFHEFPKGQGKLACELCGLPLREHTMETHKLEVRR